MKITFNAPVILSFSLMATLVFSLLHYLNLGQSLFVLSPSFQVYDPTWYLSLLGYTLGHGSWQHLIGNLSFILLLGPILEEKFGSKKLLIMIFFTGLITALFHILFFSQGLLGASGIVFMLIILISLTNVRSGEIPLSFILIVFLFIGKEVMALFQDDQVSQFAHIIGGVIGSIFGFAYTSDSGKQKSSTKNQLNL